MAVFSDTRVRILFVLTELIGGGAERSMLSIIDALDRKQFAPHLVVFTDRRDHAAPAGVRITVLERRGLFGLGRLIHRVRELRDLIVRERAELVVSFLVGPNIVSVAAAHMAGVPIVIGERSAPRTVLSRKNRHLAFSWVWAMLARAMYRRANVIVTNTQGAKAELSTFLRVPPHRVSVIPNLIDLERVSSLATEPVDDKWPRGDVLVHVGRFSYAKDHDTLLDAFARLAIQRPLSLVLVGGGEQEQRIRAKCSTMGLNGRVIFTGFTRNPYKYLGRATLCVLTSRFEGLPNTLIEAMALGVPIVSTACPYGPIELLRDHDVGVLTPVGDAAAFAAAVGRLLDDPGRRRELSARGIVRARDFDRRKVGQMYEALFKSTRATNTRR